VVERILELFERPQDLGPQAWHPPRPRMTRAESFQIVPAGFPRTREPLAWSMGSPTDQPVNSFYLLGWPD
jgi:hypothetical protein